MNARLYLLCVAVAIILAGIGLSFWSFGRRGLGEQVPKSVAEATARFGAPMVSASSFAILPSESGSGRLVELRLMGVDSAEKASGRILVFTRNLQAHGYAAQFLKEHRQTGLGQLYSPVGRAQYYLVRCDPAGELESSTMQEMTILTFVAKEK